MARVHLDAEADGQVRGEPAGDQTWQRGGHQQHCDQFGGPPPLPKRRDEHYGQDSQEDPCSWAKGDRDGGRHGRRDAAEEFAWHFGKRTQGDHQPLHPDHAMADEPVDAEPAL